MFKNSFSLAGGGKKSVKAKSPNQEAHFPRDLQAAKSEEEMKAVGCTHSFHCACTFVCALRMGCV